MATEKQVEAAKAERQEGATRGNAKADDRESSQEHAARVGQARRSGARARRKGWARAREPQPRTALRAREGEEHRRALEDGEVGSDPGDPARRLMRSTRAASARTHRQSAGTSKRVWP